MMSAAAAAPNRKCLIVFEAIAIRSRNSAILYADGAAAQQIC
jgi:hypothetical protein